MSLQIQENRSLKPFNSFGLEAWAQHFAHITSPDDLGEAMEWYRGRNGTGLLILGGGSNILFRNPKHSWVLHNAIKGIELLHEDEEYVFVRVGAGERWHSWVQYCIGRNWAGLENLSLIPGSVGASPMQNIGAYGVEVEDLFWDLEAYQLSDGKIQVFTKSDCAFGYRDSVFKGKYRNQFFIMNVTFRLRKKPLFHTSYGAITQELEQMGVTELSIRAVSDAVIRIRQSKLPDPALIGNAGSFFKNPTLPIAAFQALQLQFPGIIGYPNAAASEVKLAAGWLIEQAGWKGYREGDAGCHDKQALVLVNYGNATGEAIYSLSEKILQSVQQKFGILLEREVNCY